MLKELLQKNPLFVFALESESANEFEERNVLYTGVGKVNASYQLTKRIGKERPSIIVNLGSAGSNLFARETVVYCTQFVQRDMDAQTIGFAKYETPYNDNEIVLSNGLAIDFLENGICGTGDNFEVKHQTTDYNVIDMEAYALASIARCENIPFLCLKYISDGADGNASDDWQIMVHMASQKLSETLNKIEQIG